MNKGVKKLEVFTLGAFVVKRGDENLSYKYRLSKKPWILFKYLIANKKKVVKKETIADIIGLENYFSDVDKLIHNLVYRLRQMLGECPDDNEQDSVILFVNGGYKWNGNENYWLDTDEFDHLYKEFTAKYSDDPEEAMLLCEKAINIYKDDFLCENKCDEFTFAARSYYHNVFLKIVHNRINYLHIIQKYDEIKDLCKNAFHIDYFDMELHVEYIKALLEKGDIRQALNHYDEATARLYIQDGITLPSEMTTIYKSIKNGKRNTQYSLSGIQEELLKKAKNEGAVLYDIEAFSFIYNLERMRVKRFNQISCIVLLSIIENDNFHKPDDMFNEKVDRILKILLKTLRSSDAVTKWSENQFLILLIGMPIDHIEIAYKRIMDTYYSLEPDSDIRIIKSIKQI
ncbi:MAG: BTAD domain-containing putative transcriptional regulator [Saccharofermentanales bacterium]